MAKTRQAQIDAWAHYQGQAARDRREYVGQVLVTPGE
jgi:hypothetical protein